MKNIVSTLLILVLSGCSADTETLKLSIQNVEPWIFAGEKQGIAEKFIERFNAQKENANIQVSLSAGNLDSIKSALQSGATDIAVLHNGHRIPSNAIPMLKITNVPLVALTLKGSQANNFEPLKNKKIAYWAEEEDLLDFSEFGDKTPVNSHIDGIKMLENGEVFAFIAAMQPTRLALKSGQFDVAQFDQPFIIGRHDAWLYFSNQSKFFGQFDSVKEKIQHVLTSLESTPMR